MKKFLALALALVMSLSLVACGGNTTTDTTQNDDTTDDQTTQEVTADDIEDNMTSEDGTYEVAFVTDVGQLKDKSFNEGTWNGVKLYAYNNGLSYKYYQPTATRLPTMTAMMPWLPPLRPVPRWSCVPATSRRPLCAGPLPIIPTPSSSSSTATPSMLTAATPR